MRREQSDIHRSELSAGKFPGDSALSVGKADLMQLIDELLCQHEKEQRLIARDLHDDAAQRLALIQVESERLAQSVGADAKAALARISQQAAQLASHLHDVSNRLYPSVLEHLGLKVALEMLADRVRLPGQALVLAVETEVYELPFDTSLAVYRITEEVLRMCNRQPQVNPLLAGVAERQAGSALTLKLHQTTTETQLTAEGCSTELDLIATLTGNRLSLLRISQLAKSVGGCLLIKAGGGSGRVLQVQIPNRSN